MEKKDFWGKANGLHSGTSFYEKQERQHIIQYHEHPKTGELIVIDNWYVQDSEDDVSPEFEVIAVESPIICEILKKIVVIENKIKNL